MRYCTRHPSRYITSLKRRAVLPARAIPPGRIIEREMEARGWSQDDLVGIAGCSPETVQGSEHITPESATQLAAAFGTSSEFWLNLESNYQRCLNHTLE